MRWQRTNEEALENGIKRVKNLHQRLFDKILAKAIAEGVIGSCAAEVLTRTVIGPLNPIPRTKHLYWLQRGHTEDEANIEVLKSKIEFKTRDTKCISPFSREFWITKINPNTESFYTNGEADFERNSRRPIRKEYWMVKGYSEAQAIALAAETKDKNNAAGANSSNGRSALEKKSHSNGRCDEHWVARGSSEEEAKELVKQRQRTFALTNLMEEHGEYEGRRIWKDRQDRWQMAEDSFGEAT